MLSGLNLSIFWALLSAREQFEAVGIRDTAVQIKLIKNRSIKIISINHCTLGMSWGIYDLFSLLFICPDSRKILLRKVVQWLEMYINCFDVRPGTIFLLSKTQLTRKDQTDQHYGFGPTTSDKIAVSRGHYPFAMYRMCLSPHQLDNLRDADHWEVSRKS